MRTLCPALNVVGDSVYDLVCYAVNPTKIPKMNPESANELSVAEKLAEMEAKFEIYHSILSELKVESTVQGNSMRCRNDSGSASRSVFGGMQRGGGGSPRAASVRGMQQSVIPR